jgi:hypothetical protein
MCVAARRDVLVERKQFDIGNGGSGEQGTG